MNAIRPLRPGAHRALLSRTTLALLLGTLGWGASGSPLGAQGSPSYYEPGISPDGNQIAFVSGGDIWTVPVEGGDARLLVAHSAHESRPLFSPDGLTLAFNTNRHGSLDIYLLELATGDLRRLTHDAASQQLTGWSRDGEWVYFSTSAHDVNGMSDVFRVRASGGTPMPVAGDRYASEYFGAPAPGGGLLALATRARMAESQWWRNGHSHIDESEIWLVREPARPGSAPEYAPLTTGGKNLWPMFGADAEQIYFMSDRSGAENLWTAPVAGGDERRLTDFTEGRVLWPSISTDGRTIAFERDFGIWTLDVESGAVREVPIRLVGAVEGPGPEVQDEDSGWGDITVSPDGRKWAFTRGGEVWATTMEGDLPATRITRTPAAEGNLTWSRDSEQLVYTSWRSGTPRLYAWDFRTGTERALPSGPGRDGDAAFSPDGSHLAWIRSVDETVELVVMEWPSGAVRRLATGVVGAFDWSPDGRWIAYGGETDAFTNVMVVPVDGGAPRQVSFLANSFLGALQWSGTGDFIVFRTAQRTEPGRLVKVDLVPLPPVFDEDGFDSLFVTTPDDAPEPGTTDPDEGRGEEAADTVAPVRIDFEGIRRRGYIIPTDFSVGTVTLAPDGESGVITGDGANHRITFKPNGEIDIERLDASGAPLGFDAEGRRLYLAQGGKLRVLTLASGATRTVETSVRYTEEFDATKVAAFEQGWGEMRDGFYDADYHGADWTAIRDRFRPQIEGARTRAEFNRLMNLMLGELNASHLGHSGRTGPPAGGEGANTGRLGLRFDRLAYEEEGRFEVSEVIALGPAAIAGGITPGDEVRAVDGIAVNGGTDLDRLLKNRTGEKVVLRVAREGAERDVEVLAASAGAERQLVYRDWVESRRAYVNEISGGRLGYVHIASMSEGALEQLIFDLDQENHAREGVVVDVRNNNGGFVNVYAIDILARRNYFTMQGRGRAVEAPSRAQLGQRALLSPTVLVTNQNTLSDGEDFTEGYRTLGLGTVVGEPTAGWIIFTGSAGLVDGTSVRMPRTRIRTLTGENMELAPRPVDVEVVRPTGEWYQGRDSQLERAVEVLLRQIDGGN